jgi:hypothetical protein
MLGMWPTGPAMGPQRSAPAATAPSPAATGSAPVALPGNHSGGRPELHPITPNELLSLGVLLVLLLPLMLFSRSTVRCCRRAVLAVLHCPVAARRAWRIRRVSGRGTADSAASAWHETTLTSALAKSDGAEERGVDEYGEPSEAPPPSYKEVDSRSGGDAACYV